MPHSGSKPTSTSSWLEPADEVKERQEAELEFVSVAYSSDEAWVSTTTSVTTATKQSNSNDDTSTTSSFQKYKLNCVHRRLDLPLGENNDEKIIPLELILTMPLEYPINPSCTLEIDVTVIQQESNPTDSTTTTTTGKNYNNDVTARKMALDAIPNLIQVCEEIAADEYIEEAVLAIFTRADEWIETEWKELRLVAHNQHTNKHHHLRPKQDNLEISCRTKDGSTVTTTALVLGRRLVFSHHIIAKSKRKALKDLSREYRLGGYAKIGWPGIIIIEGEDNDCNRFIDEIRSMRWQHLAVRGEEQVAVVRHQDCNDVVDVAKRSTTSSTMDDLDALRKFPLQFVELEENQMSHLAKICDDVGLKELFMTSMKIYAENDKQQQDHSTSNDDTEGNNVTGSSRITNISSFNNDSVYGVLLHIDHMNDEKGYCKWIQKSCKSVNCNFLIKKCHPNNYDSDKNNKNNNKKKPIIIVCLWGDIDSVKQVLKRWRTSRVDVDSRGNPCLERMMSVITEGMLNDKTDEDYCHATFDDNDDKQVIVTLDELKRTIGSIGGELWVNTLSEQLLC